MKREEIKAVLENAEMDNDAKLKAIMDFNGKDLTESKTTIKALEEKAKGHDELQAKIDELTKQVDTMKEFEKKAKGYDELLPKYEDAMKNVKDNEVTNKVKANGFDDKFVKFIKAEMSGKEGEELDSALKEYAEKNPQFLVPNPKKVYAPQMQPGNAGGEEDLSKIF